MRLADSFFREPVKNGRELNRFSETSLVGPAVADTTTFERLNMFEKLTIEDLVSASDAYHAAKELAVWQDRQETLEVIACNESWQDQECCFCGQGLDDSELHRGYCSDCD